MSRMHEQLAFLGARRSDHKREFVYSFHKKITSTGQVDVYMVPELGSWGVHSSLHGEEHLHVTYDKATAKRLKCAKTIAVYHRDPTANEVTIGYIVFTHNGLGAIRNGHFCYQGKLMHEEALEWYHLPGLEQPGRGGVFRASYVKDEACMRFTFTMKVEFQLPPSKILLDAKLTLSDDGKALPRLFVLEYDGGIFGDASPENTAPMYYFAL